VRTAATVSETVGASKSLVPVSISYSTTAKAQIDLHDIVRPDLDVGRLQVTMDDTLRLLEPVHLGDVRVILGREQVRFAFESCRTFNVGSDLRGEQFERDIATEAQVARPVDFAHPPRRAHP
jgi:hypothetical protein